MKKNTKKNRVIKCEKIQSSFTSSELTNYSGILPIKKFIDKLGIENSINEKISIKLRPNHQYSTGQIIMSVVLAEMCGLNRIAKVEKFTEDPLVRKIIGIENKIDEDTMSGRVKRFRMKQSKELMDIIGEKSKIVHKKLKTRRDILDFDSTEHTVYGNQEGAKKGYNPKNRGKKSYHSLLAFLNSTKECTGGMLRPGDSYTSNNASGLLQEVLGRMSKEISAITVRADSGFFDGKFIETIETDKRGLKYIIKVKLKNLEAILEKQIWEEVVGDESKQITEFYYKCKGWEKARKFVAIRKKIEEVKEGILFPYCEYESFCYVTNIKESPLYLHSFYGDRGEIENWIEALKNQLYAGKMITNKFWANEALFLCSIIGYNLSVWMRKLTDKKSWREEPMTFRMWFIQLAGKLVNSGRRIYLKMYKSFYDKIRWKQIDDAIDRIKFA
jgi:hypothetical protein